MSLFKKCHKKAVSPEAHDLAAKVSEHAAAAGKQAAALATQLAEKGGELATTGIAWAAPKIEGAAEKIRPVVDDLSAKASVAYTNVREDYIPRAKAAAHAAAEAARNADGDLRERAIAIQEEARKALAPEPVKKKKSFMKKFGITAIVAGIGAAGYVLWKRSQPVEDPWAEAYWEDQADDAPFTTAECEGDSCGCASDKEETMDLENLKNKASEALDKAQDLAGDAKDKAKDLAGDAKEAVEGAVETVSEKIKEFKDK